jgi:hypothetical protein
MNKSLIFLFACCVQISALAQAPEEYLVRAGEEPSDVIPRIQQFYFPDFRQGQVFYPQGKRSDVLLLNYNTLLDVMQYIDSNGDTLFIPEESNIFKYVRIGEEIFYHHFREGYFNLHSREDNYNLATRTRWKIERRDLMISNGYGTMEASPGSTISNKRVGNRFVQNEDMAYSYESAYYVVGPRDVVFRANRAGFMKSFPDNKNEIQAFIREHQTDFDDEQSLKLLVSFTSSLIKASGGQVSYKPKGN